MTVQSGSDKTQRQRFEEAAREVGCDQSEEVFEENLRRVASATSTVKEKGKAEKKPRRKK